jgi:hypothetical protein
MKTRGAGPVVYGDAMLRHQFLAFPIHGLHDLIWKAQEVHFSLRLEVCSNAPITNPVENIKTTMYSSRT